MNIPPIQQQGTMAVNQLSQPVNPQMPQNQQQAQQAQQQQAQQQQQQQQQQAQEKLDNISKVKSLVGPLRESLAVGIKTAAQTLHQNSLVDIGSLKGIDQLDHRFNKNMEEFYSICDQMELHLKTSIECLSQNSSSIRYLPMTVLPTRTDTVSAQEGPALTYPQFLMTVRAQVGYAKEVHDTLVSAARTIAPGE
ncbi:mediator of RNA polymerase II transcription subunit 29 [Polistes fuscatus]|uniref:mediator of RNA polymerase II transcription subunit 29 n=1 Tax=Polistes fuscatus TaxID=30207 RepID=UPI001CA7DAA3|nr:mediator of RNA polymerase II transcription subunit 29 [Polistes fuscatus]XP_043490987.1 mediator of RNA polymerase II transcription subunit 29 [Polistes fuscatus]